MYFKCHRVFLQTFDVICDYFCNKSHWPVGVWFLGGGQWILNNCNVFIEMRMRLHLWDLKCPRMMWIIAEKGGAQEINWIENPDKMCTHHHLQQTVSGLHSLKCFLRMRNNILFLRGHLCAGYWWLYWPVHHELRAASESCKQLRVKVPDSQW